MRKLAVLIGLSLSLAACGSLGDVAQNKRYQINSLTMEPTVAEGSTVTARVVRPGDYQPRAGDVVMFDPPNSYGWNPDGRPRILRVVAVPGDTIVCCDAQGRITLNGIRKDEPYIQVNGMTVESQPVTVPAGEIYLLGDYRGAANDSSQNGTVPAENVIGVVKL